MAILDQLAINRNNSSFMYKYTVGMGERGDL